MRLRDLLVLLGPLVLPDLPVLLDQVVLLVLPDLLVLLVLQDLRDPPDLLELPAALYSGRKRGERESLDGMTTRRAAQETARAA